MFSRFQEIISVHDKKSEDFQEVSDFRFFLKFIKKFQSYVLPFL